VPYTFAVTNTGNTTLTAAVIVSDNKVASVTCPTLPAGGLAPGAGITCTGSYTTTQADLDAGSVINTASAKSGTVTSSPGSHTLPANQSHGLVMMKTASPTTFSAPGVSIAYTYVVKNTGNITLPAATVISVSDNKIASVSCPPLPASGLAPNATLTCSATFVTTQADLNAGSITNTASASDGVATSPTVSATVTGLQSPALAIVKATTTANFNATGVLVPYTFKVTNSGNVTLTSAITVTDSKIGSVTCPSIGTGLIPGAFITCAGSYTTLQADLDAGSVVNTASAKSGATVSATDSHALPAVLAPALTIVKTSTVANFAASGVSLPYSYKVANAGNTTLTAAISVTDNKIAAVTCPALPAGGLAPGDFITCTGSAVTTQADVDAGGVTNTASAASGSVVAPVKSLTIPALKLPALLVEKSSLTASFAVVGQSVPYSFKVTNSGNTTLISAITVTDNKIASVTCPALPAGGLAPAAFITCSGTYITTQTDIDAGGVTNSASAKSGTTTSSTVNLTIASAQLPALLIVKSSTTTAFTAANVAIPYSFKVTNTGNTTLTTAVTVSDSKITSVSCPSIGAGLAPGAFIICTGNYTTLQSDVDAGGITNTASASSGAVVSPTVSLTVTSTRTPALSIVKSTTATTYTTLNQLIPYSFVVTNSGNTTLTSAIAVTDSKIGTVSCPSIGTGLAPGNPITCTGTYTITQADIDGGNVLNTAVATSGSVTSPTVTYSLAGTQTAKLTIAKSSTTTSVTTLNQSVPYSFDVKNTGNVTLTVPVTVSDSKIASVSCPPIGAGLAVNASITCTGSYLVTQADLDSGSVVNTATAASGAGATTIGSNTVALTIPVVQSPALSLVKSAPPAAYTAVGQTISYSFLAKNTGNVTITTPLSISDDKIASPSCPGLPAGGLAPNATLTCTGSYTVTQADLDGGSVVNTATAKSGPTVSTPPQIHTQYAGQTRALTLTKTPSTMTYATVGTSIIYTYVVKNTSNVTIPASATVSVSDNKIASVSCPGLPAGGLAPNASLTCSAAYVITQIDLDAGSVLNKATATDGIATSPQVSATVTATQMPSLSIVKNTTTSNFSAPGVSVPYTFLVANTGNVTLISAITVADSRIAAVSCPPIGAGLAPAASITCTGSYSTTQSDVDAGSVVNTATAKSGTTVSQSGSHTLTASQSRVLTVAKSGSPTTFAAVGTTIAYTYVVTNSGNITIPAASVISVSDNKLATVSCPALSAAGLGPTKSINCTASYLTKQSDLDAGSITNVASATDGVVTSPLVSATITAVQSPALSVVKATIATVYATVGQVIPYTFAVKNSGNTTLTSAVTVSDNKIASVSCPSIGAGLAPGASITCTANYAITQADIDSGSVVNTAFAKSATTTSTPPVTHVLNGSQTAALTIVKSTTSAGFSAAGVAIPYSYLVTNTGNVTLTSAISVSDNRIAAVTCPALPAGGLLPTASITCTGSYATTQADIDAGKVTNTAAAASGTVVSPSTSLSVNAMQTPALALVKTSTTPSFATVGASVSYTYKVTNSGNLTLTSAVTVSDNKIASVSCPALPAGGLTPGASITCSGTYSATQADLDAGKVINIATAASGATTSAASTVTVNAAQAPALSVLKTSPTTSIAAAGVAVPYSYKVTNTGNVTLTAAVTVADNKIASVSCPALPVGGLAPGAFITCAGSYTTVQADVDVGSLTNTAAATSGTTTSPTTSLTISGSQVPALSIVKTSTTTSFAIAGTAVPYSYKVTNTGNVSLTSAITVSDNKIAAVTCPALPAGGLAPAAFITCTATYTITQADMDAGALTNSASAKSGGTTSPITSLTINAAQVVDFSIVKSSVTTAFASPGTAINYAFKVTNTGNVTISVPISVTDSKIAAVSCPALPAGGLAPTKFISCTAIYTVTQADVDAGGVTNYASAKSGPYLSISTNLTIPATQTSLLGIAKTSSTVSYGSVGSTVPYSYKVTNLGNITLTTPIAVTDNKIASVSCPALPTAGLNPGAFIMCTGSAVTTQADLDAGSIVNTAKATSGAISSPTVMFTVIAAQAPALTVVKSSPATGFSAVGTVLSYNYKVTNTGNTTLIAPITVSDDKIAAVTCPALPSGGLRPNGFVTCTGSYAVAQADLDAGSVVNTASGKSGTLVSPTVSLTITGTQSPALSIVKTSTATSFVAVGDTLPYSYKVTNTGNITLTSAVTVADNKIPAVTCPALPLGGLTPGAVLTCTGTYAATQLDLDAGSVSNTASAKSGPVVSPVVVLTINATQKPNFTVVKTTTTQFATNNGDGTFTASFQVVVTNTGNVDLTDVQLVDDYGSQLPKGASVKSAKIKSTVSSTRGQLATANPLFAATAAAPNLIVGQGETLAVTETITSQFDIKFDPGANPSGSTFGNTVVAKTVFGRGTPLATAASRTGVAVFGFVANKPLIVSKTTPKTDITRGDLVPYTITVRNSDAVARTGLTLVDNMPAGFKYRVGSASVDGVMREPVLNGRVLQWPNVTVTPTKPLTLKLVLIAGAGIGMGEFTNEAWVTDLGGVIASNVGKATVRMIGDPTFDCTDIIGKVFDDADRSGYADDGKRGIANVRLATARGQLVTTDSEGRYHIACADIPESDRGTNFILKLDERTLPTGYRVTTENPRVIRITAGKMAKINFGAAVTRVARLDLSDAAFEVGNTRLQPRWHEGLGKVFEALKTERSVLRIAYRRKMVEDNALAEARVKALSAAIQEQWKRDGANYPLMIETEVYADRSAQR
jgi:large repetitive protein